MEQDTNTNSFPALDSCTFLFRGEQKRTLGGLPIAQQTFDRPWKHACSAVMDNNNIKKTLRNWLREVLIQAMSHVQKDSTQSAHSEEPDKSQRVWKAEIGLSRVGINAASSGSP